MEPGAAESVPLQDMHATLGELRPVLLKIAHTQLRNDVWAEDVVSETLVAALENAATFAGRSQLKTWVVSILRHKMIDHMRRFNREVSIEAQLEAGAIPDLDWLFTESGGRVDAPLDWSDPERALSRAEFIDILQLCIDRLPPALARVFMMREWLELDTGQICRQLDINRDHCFVLLYRARNRLRECLERRWFAGSAAAMGPPDA